MAVHEIAVATSQPRISGRLDFSISNAQPKNSAGCAETSIIDSSISDVVAHITDSCYPRLLEPGVRMIDLPSQRVNDHKDDLVKHSFRSSLLA